MAPRTSAAARRVSVTLIATTIAVVGCATKSVTTTPVYRPTFDYTPPAQAAPASAGVIFALVNPRYAEAVLVGDYAPSNPALGPWSDDEPFSGFARSLRLDFEELLTARGFSVTGPYVNRELMTFPERQGSDFALVAILEVSPATTDLTVDGQLLALFGPTNTISGTEHLAGRVTLSLEETLTGERMWTRSIELPERRVPWASARRYTNDDAVALQTWSRRAGTTLGHLEDPGYLNPVSKALEEYYPMILRSVWDHLDPDEMRILKGLAADLKARYAPIGRRP